MKLNLIFLFGLLINIIFGSQYVPLQGRIPGIVKGPANAILQVELIYDPMCDDTAEFDLKWVNIQNRIAESSQLKDKIKFRYISLPLPYHITAQKITQGMIYVLKHKGDLAALDYFRYFLRNIAKYNEDVTKTMTLNQYKAKIVDAISSMFGVSQSELMIALEHGSPYDGFTRQWGKFLIGALHASGTPRSLINWVQVDGGIDKSQNDWIQLLTDLVNRSL